MIATASNPAPGAAPADHPVWASLLNRPVAAVMGVLNITPDSFSDGGKFNAPDHALAQARRMIAFCGLEWDEACLSFHRTARQVRTASVWQARQPVYKTPVARWRRYEPWLGELRELVAE